ncbi:hypothetical protein JRI60_38770 [Archangium violaceum]|uniref:hypothetical protein n=1 Tax=Archangium violaceum TaxID=83451 RepID=UPI0019504B81|nr:hypothetical protein [Archangium violaceum]QRN94992.1 hypothetical protein JRI60_38770 [Archangium violaceum]
MEHVSLSAELGEICYAIEGAHWIADSVAMGAVPDPDRTHSAPVIISAILQLEENRPFSSSCAIRASRASTSTMPWLHHA